MAVLRFALLLAVAAQEVPSSTRDPSQAGQLTAADIDDTLNFESYLTFHQRAVEQDPSLPNPSLTRVPVQVRDSAGTPFSCAIVTACCTGAGGSVELPTGSNGQLSLFTELDGLVRPVRVSARAANASCPAGCGEEVTEAAEGDGPLEVSVPGVSALPTQLDVTFTVDTTGSMGDELQYLQTEILSILQGLSQVDVRAGLVLYKDKQDAYLVQSTPLSGGVEGVVATLQNASANGGGDYPEAMAEAMEAAVALQWRPGNVARVMFLVADAPPHSDKFDRALAAAQEARSKGIKVYGLAASGVGDSAEYLMRLMSMLTGARYLWLTDDSGIGDPHAEPKVRCYQVTRLDQLIQRVLLSELQGQRVEPQEDEILREVGKQEAGVCLVEMTTTRTSTTTSAQESADGSTTPCFGCGFELIPSAGDAVSMARGSEASATSGASSVQPVAVLTAGFLLFFSQALAPRALGY